MSWVKRVLILCLFMLIGMLMRSETIDFMYVIGVDNAEKAVGIVDIVVNAFTTPLLAIYFIMPVSFGLYYMVRMQDHFEPLKLPFLLTRFSSRRKFMNHHLVFLAQVIFEYISYYFFGVLFPSLLMGHLFSPEHYHYIISYTTITGVMSNFLIIVLFVFLGLLMIGLFTLTIYLICRNILLVLFVILCLSFIHTISYTTNIPDIITALLPFSQYARGLSVQFAPFGMSLSWYTSFFQLGYLILLVGALLLVVFKLFNYYEV